jgi:hypothetical protein
MTLPQLSVRPFSSVALARFPVGPLLLEIAAVLRLQPGNPVQGIALEMDCNPFGRVAVVRLLARS